LCLFIARFTGRPPEGSVNILDDLPLVQEHLPDFVGQIDVGTAHNKLGTHPNGDRNFQEQNKGSDLWELRNEKVVPRYIR
jgi:hypothetical protein